MNETDKPFIVRIDPDADAFTRGGFTQVPNVLLRDKDLSAGAKITYSSLLQFAWSRDEVHPGQLRLAADLGITDKTLRGYLDDLEAHGWLSSMRRGQGLTNLYTLHVRTRTVKTTVQESRTVKTTVQEPENLPFSTRARSLAEKYKEETDEINPLTPLEKILFETKTVSKANSDYGEDTDVADVAMKRAYVIVDAYCKAVGIAQSSFAKGGKARIAKHFCLYQGLTPEDVAAVVSYLRTDPWYQEPGRLTPQAVTKVWPEWKALGRPASRKAPSNGYQSADERRQARLAQLQAEYEAGDEDESVIEAEWSEE